MLIGIEGRKFDPDTRNLAKSRVGYCGVWCQSSGQYAQCLVHAFHYLPKSVLATAGDFGSCPAGKVDPFDFCPDFGPVDIAVKEVAIFLSFGVVAFDIQFDYASSEFPQPNISATSALVVAYIEKGAHPWAGELIDVFVPEIGSQAKVVPYIFQENADA